MAISRQQKEELVKRYAEKIQTSSAIVFTDYRGATVAQMNSLRDKQRAAGSTYMVVKNTLLKLALAEAGHQLDLEGLLEGPNAVAFIGEDIGKGVKAMKDWIKQQGVVSIKGAILEQDVLDADQASALAELPTREEMLAKLLATILAPASQLVRTINEPGASLARVLQARVDAAQQEAA